MSQISAGILGGCVPRDTLEYAGPDVYRVTRYIARHSILAIGTNAAPNLPSFYLESRFQDRTVKYDLWGLTCQTLAQLKNLDVFLWDLNSERSGVWLFDDGSIATNSPEFRSIPHVAGFLSGAKLIEFGSDAHFNRWMGAANVFVGFLAAIGLKPRTLVLGAEWAHRDERGTPTRSVGGRNSAQWNAIYSKYYEHLESLGLELLEFHDTISDSKHKWGPASFHYVPEVYARIDAAIRTAIQVDSIT